MIGSIIGNRVEGFFVQWVPTGPMDEYSMKYPVEPRTIDMLIDRVRGHTNREIAEKYDVSVTGVWKYTRIAVALLCREVFQPPVSTPMVLPKEYEAIRAREKHVRGDEDPPDLDQLPVWARVGLRPSSPAAQVGLKSE